MSRFDGALNHDLGLLMSSSNGKAWLSPLRYPGSKRRLTPYIRAALRENQMAPSLFVEPFAGGASVALQLLGEGSVERIGIADKDPLIAAFWKTVFWDSEWLIDKVHTVEVSLDRWKKWKSKARTSDLPTRERALACLFLNRTSFSGILSDTAGPLGGMEQNSKYKIDCRFPRDTLSKRIRMLAGLSHRVSFVWEKPWRETFSLLRRMQSRDSAPNQAFYYLDPPFFHKADRLYQHYFENGKHGQLRDLLVSADEPWLLSYDACPAARNHYKNHEFELATVELLYNTPGNGNYAAASEIIVSNLNVLPNSVELWQRGDRRGVVTTVEGNGAR